MKYFIALILCAVLFTGCEKKSNDNKNNYENTSNISVNRTSTNTNMNSVQNNSNNNNVENVVEPQKEELLFTYSTKILDKSPERQNNVKIACSELNGSIVKSGEIFSFTSTLGPAKPEEGYEKAKTFDQDGDIVQEYGGGKCQISSTLYNAVKDLPGISIIERHEHSSDVYYVPEGQDAAVSYGSVDFKFRNDNSYNIRIDASCTENDITINIVKTI